MNKKPSVLLKEVDFSFEEDENSLGPHIALTFAMQGGAASGYNKPLLFKADDVEITPELIEKIKLTGEDTTALEKAMFNSTLQRLLSQALNDKEFVDRWDYIYISDFDESNVIFYTDEGLFSVDYTMNDSSVELGDIASPVISINSYMEVDGEVLVSEDIRQQVQESFDAEVLALINRSSKALPEEFVELIKKNNSKINDPVITQKNNSVIKSEGIKSGDENTSGLIINKNKGDPSMDLNEILKSPEMAEFMKQSIAEATQKATADLEATVIKAEAEKAALQKSVEDLQKAETARVQATYTDVVKGFGFVEADKVEAVVKALMADQQNSMIFVEMLKTAHEQIETVKAEFAKEKGADIKTDAKKDPNEFMKGLAQTLKASQTK